MAANHPTRWVKGDPRIPKSPGRPRLGPDPALGFDHRAVLARLTPVALGECERILLSTRRTAAMEQLKFRIAEWLLDRQHGRPNQSISGPDGGPLAVSFTELLRGIDGSPNEKFNRGNYPPAP